MTDVLCKLPFAEFFEKNRIRCKPSLPDFHKRCEQDCSRPAAFKNATVRERPFSVIRPTRLAVRFAAIAGIPATRLLSLSGHGIGGGDGARRSLPLSNDPKADGDVRQLSGGENDCRFRLTARGNLIVRVIPQNSVSENRDRVVPNAL